MADMIKMIGRLKIFITVFVLVFAGFAAMMTAPTVLAQDPTVTTEPAEDIIEVNHLVVNRDEEKALLDVDVSAALEDPTGDLVIKNFFYIL